LNAPHIKTMEVSRKPVLAIDIDEVLAAFIPTLCKFYNQKHGLDFTASSFFSYEFHYVMQCTPDECNAEIHSFFASDIFKTSVEPIQGAYESLLRLSEKFELHVVTARQLIYEKITRKWLDQNYPNVFTEVHFGNHYCEPGQKSRKKSEICRSIGAICLIDDSLKYAKDCASNNIACVLFGDYAWNQGIVDELHHMQFVQRASTWTAVEQAISCLEEVEVMVNTDGDRGSDTRVMTVFNLSARYANHRLNVLSLNRYIPPTAGNNSRSFTIGVVQMCSKADKISNLSIICRRIIEAAEEGAKLVCLPEACCYLGCATLANTEDSSTSTCLAIIRNVAQKCGVWVSVGGIHIKAPDAPIEDIEDAPKNLNQNPYSPVSSHKRLYNRHYLLGPQGQEFHYDKIHLFDNTLTGLRESATTSSGKEIVVADLGFVKVGLSVCYDLRFPAFTSRLREQGADIILAPSAFTQKTGISHWELLLRARALDTQCYVIAAAQCGIHNTSRTSFGNSMVTTPWGMIAAQLGCDDGNGNEEGALLITKIDLNQVKKAREALPVYEHMRSDVY
jgi:deaminated glutathione amidase